MEYITGFHAIEEAIRSGNIKGTLYLSKSGNRYRKIENEALKKALKCIKTDDKEIEKLSGIADHRGIALAAEFKNRERENITLKNFLKELNKEKALILLLDGITDPHNYGAILRSADQFGVSLVIIPSRRSVKESEIIGKTSAGAREFVNVATENLARAADMLKEAGFWIYAADMKGETAYNVDLKGKTALIMGSEGKGISKILLDKSDGMISIPCCGRIDSLNVSVAAGILLYEAVRQNSL